MKIFTKKLLKSIQDGLKSQLNCNEITINETAKGLMACCHFDEREDIILDVKTLPLVRQGKLIPAVHVSQNGISTVFNPKEFELKPVLKEVIELCQEINALNYTYQNNKFSINIADVYNVLYQGELNNLITTPFASNISFSIVIKNYNKLMKTLAFCELKSTNKFLVYAEPSTIAELRSTVIGEYIHFISSYDSLFEGFDKSINFTPAELAGYFKSIQSLKEMIEI